MLKAAVPVNGRAITIYEQVFPFRRYNNPSAHLLATNVPHDRLMPRKIKQLYA